MREIEREKVNKNEEFLLYQYKKMAAVQEINQIAVFKCINYTNENIRH